MPRTNRRNQTIPELRSRQITVMEVGDASGVSLEIEIPGQPISQPRGRFGSTRTRRVYVYNPGARAKAVISSKIKQELIVTGLLQPPTPTSTPQAIFNAPVMVTATFGVADMTKDLDNMLKFILDVFEDAGVYVNDRLVRKIVAEKVDSAGGFTYLNVSNI